MGTEGISAESVYTWAQQCGLPLYLLIFIGSPQGLLLHCLISVLLLFTSVSWSGGI